MINEILIQKKTLHFKESFQIAYEKVEMAEVVIIKITDNMGNYGLGSAAPDEEVTGETVNKVYQKLKKELDKDFFKIDIADWYKYHEKIEKKFAGWPACQAAVEEAILNLFCAKKKIPLTSVFGDYRKSCPIMITIGIKSLGETLDEVKKRIKEQYKTIKLKGGLQLEEDIIKIKAVDKILPKKVELVLDVNQGYSFDQAKKLLLTIKKTKLKLIEQPIDAKNIQGLKKLTKISSIPIIADEAVVSVNDASKLLKGDYIDGVNIKLMKCGGPTNFLKIFNLAKSLNKIIIIGCMYESQISLTTGAALALALPIDYADLDSGRLDFLDDPAKGGVIIEGGQIKKIRQLKLK